MVLSSSSSTSSDTYRASEHIVLTDYFKDINASLDATSIETLDPFKDKPIEPYPPPILKVGTKDGGAESLPETLKRSNVLEGKSLRRHVTFDGVNQVVQIDAENELEKENERNEVESNEIKEIKGESEFKSKDQIEIERILDVSIKNQLACNTSQESGFSSECKSQSVPLDLFSDQLRKILFYLDPEDADHSQEVLQEKNTKEFLHLLESKAVKASEKIRQLLLDNDGTNGKVRQILEKLETKEEEVSQKESMIKSMKLRHERELYEIRRSFDAANNDFKEKLDKQHSQSSTEKQLIQRYSSFVDGVRNLHPSFNTGGQSLDELLTEITNVFTTATQSQSFAHDELTIKDSKLEKLSLTKCELETQIELHKKNILSLSLQLQERQGQLEDLQRANVSNSHGMELLNEKLKFTQNLHHDLEIEYGSLQEEKFKISEQNIKLLSQQATLKEEVERLRSSKALISSELQSYQEEIIQTEGRYKQRISVLEADNHRSNSEKKELRKLNAELEEKYRNELKQKDALIDVQKSQISKMMKKVDQFRSKLNERKQIHDDDILGQGSIVRDKFRKIAIRNGTYGKFLKSAYDDICDRLFAQLTRMISSEDIESITPTWEKLKNYSPFDKNDEIDESFVLEQQKRASEIEQFVESSLSGLIDRLFEYHKKTTYQRGKIEKLSTTVSELTIRGINPRTMSTSGQGSTSGAHARTGSSVVASSMSSTLLEKKVSPKKHNRPKSRRQGSSRYETLSSIPKGKDIDDAYNNQANLTKNIGACL
ncbi:BA75_00891T0 [Komagataella pastoris]|uniref:BA75_00891T0 n=1 Tax=Komagataella pastoris TaxID=4922 RepID=A0A1B2JA17_PICPA|nr:BA75_00891T0 [Komagataella pastoris]